jgi:hypothetical protein
MSEHQKMSDATINRLLKLHANQEVLTDWERALIKDRLEALKKYELCAVATRKQVYQIGQIWKKFKLKQKLKKVEI